MSGPDRGRPGRAALAMAATVALATVWVFANVRTHEFLHYDDDHYVVDNPLMQNPMDLRGLGAMLAPHHDNWIPLTWLSLRLDHALHGRAAPGFLYTNVALHILAATVLFLALTRMSGAPGPSVFCAAVFALHPLHVESVAWISERKDVLSGLMWMLALLAYTRYVERPSAVRYLTVTGIYALGLMAKPSVVTLPLTLFLLDFFPLSRIGPRPDAAWRRSVVEKLPWFAMAGGVAWATWWVQRTSGAMHFAQTLSPGVRVANAIESYVFYMHKAIWPADLSVFYPHPARVDLGAVLACGALLCLVTGVCLHYARTRPYLITGWSWFLITLLPTLGLVQVGMQAHADRYAYIPLIGLSIAAAWAGREISSRGGAPRVAVHLCAGAAVVALAIVARARVPDWQNTETLFGEALAVAPDNPIAHHQLGSLRLRDGQLEAAYDHFEAARRGLPGWTPPEIGLGQTAMKMNRLEEASEHYQRVLKLAPERLDVYAQWGIVLIAIGRETDARRALEHVLSKLPDAQESQRGLAAVARIGLGDIERDQGNLDAAIASYDRGLALVPDHLEGQSRRLTALVAAQRLAEASRDAPVVAALAVLGTPRVRAELAATLIDLADAHAQRGEPKRALRMAKQAFKLLEGGPASEETDARIDHWRQAIASEAHTP